MIGKIICLIIGFIVGTFFGATIIRMLIEKAVIL